MTHLPYDDYLDNRGALSFMLQSLLHSGLEQNTDLDCNYPQFWEFFLVDSHNDGIELWVADTARYIVYWFNDLGDLIEYSFYDI